MWSKHFSLPSSRSSDDDARMEEERRLMYVGITRARKRLFLSRASTRMLYNQESHNPPSRFLQEIPDRLKEDVWTPRKIAAFGEKAMTTSSYGRRTPRPAMNINQLGKPKLTLNGTSLNRSSIKGAPLEAIPGVSRGFAGSKVHDEDLSGALGRMFQKGDKVLHQKFGAGKVLEVKGSGAEARIVIHFTAYGSNEFAMSISPIVKLEEEE